MAQDRASPTSEQVEAAIRQLRPIERTVLLLSARERLTNNAIAAQLGLTPEQVGRILGQALGRMDRFLERGA